jgi:hypothetical protein
MRRTLGSMLAPMAIMLASPAGAWEFVDVMNAYGDQATGIVQPARSDPETILAVGCDGDRWRIVGLTPRSERGVDLDSDGMVRHSFGPELGQPAKWEVKRRPNGQIMYVAPSPTEFVRLMIREEKKSPDAALRVEVRSHGRASLLEFPLSGLRSGVRKDLWGPCKLENYFPEAAAAD